MYGHGCENVGWNATSQCVRGYVLAREEYTRVWRVCVHSCVGEYEQTSSPQVYFD